jgi:hypothetical protein
MAIREVLVSFTFEQQRQMINLIGTDVGDASLLLTPTNVVVTAINEVINGDVDLANQTIGMDDGTLASPSLFWDSGQGFYKVDANKLGLTSSLAITGDLEVDGDITFRAGSGTGGTLTFGDLNTDNIVFNADMQSSIIPDTTANYNLGSVAQQWNNLWIDGTASIDTLTVDENSQFIGYLQVDSGDIRVPNTQTVVDLFDDYATTVEAFGDATDMRFGADDATGEFLIRSGLIKTSRPTLEVFNTIATTVNAFGAASNVIMGLSTFGTTGVNSNFNIRSDDTVLDGDLNVNGGELLSSSNTFDLLIANSDINIGAANGAGDTTINNTLAVKENLDLSNSGTNVLIKDNLVNSLVVKEGSNDYVRFTTTDADEKILIYKDVYIVGNLDISGTTTSIDVTNLLVEDKNIELGVTTAAATDAGADGGGITLKATTDKTITYNNTTASWNTNIPVYIKPGSNVPQLKLEQDNAADGWKFHADGPNGGHLYIQREASAVDTTALSILNSGDVGIGPEDPVERLHVSKNSASGPFICVTNDSTGHTITDGLQIGYDGSNDAEIRNRENTNIKVYTNDTERLKIGSTGTITFKGTLVEKMNYDSGTALTGTYNYDLEAGNVHYVTTVPTGPFTYNLRVNSGTTLNSVMEVGDAISFTLLVRADTPANYLSQLQIDGTNEAVLYAGGTAPTAASGNNGYDSYNFTIIKTFSGLFDVFGTFTNHV